MVSYINFHNTLYNLARFWAYYQENSAAQADEVLIELQKMGLIKSYEICYEALLKVLRLYLIEDIGMAIDVNTGAKPTFRAANDTPVLQSPLSQWFKYVDMRNTTAHEYGVEKVDEAVELLPDFIEDAIGLYQAMSGQSWD